MSGQFVIETQGLSKTYGSHAAVRDLTLSVATGQITGFLGRNGAGKSTLIKMLLGLVHTTAGAATVLDHSIGAPKQNREMRRRVAYVAEDKPLYGYMTVEQMIAFTKSFYSDWRIDVEHRLMARFQLPHNRKIKALSKGMRTKLALLLALARRPELLILDEPSEGLDPVSIEQLLEEMASAASEGTTVFFSSHQIAEVERIADRVSILDRGRLVSEFTLDELRENYRRITFGFSHQLPDTDFLMPGVLSIRRDGRQISLLTSHGADYIAEFARSFGPVSLEVTPSSLREVFLEQVKGDEYDLVQNLA